VDTVKHSRFDHALITRWRGAECREEGLKRRRESEKLDLSMMNVYKCLYSNAFAKHDQTMPFCSSGVSRPDTPVGK